MDILYVTLSPIDSTFSMSFRNRSVLKGFVELGHNVDVLTIYPHNSNIKIDKPKIIDKVNIIRINNTPDKATSKLSVKKGESNFSTRFIRSIYHRFMPFDSSFFLLKKLKGCSLPQMKYDIIISSSDPKTSHLAVRRLIKSGLKFERWIQYWGDPLAKDITSKLIYPQRVLLVLERNILKYADKIVYVSPITLMEQQNLFKDLSQKMTFLPIPYEKTKWYPETENKTFTIGYFGFYLRSVRNIFPLYDAVKNLSENVHLNIVGHSDLKLDNHQNISIYPNTNDIGSYELKTDLIVVILNRFGGQIPGKLYHLAATNKSVMVILDGNYKNEIGAYLERFNRFILCENSEESIARTIKDILNSNKASQPCTLLEPVSIAGQLLM